MQGNGVFAGTFEPRRRPSVFLTKLGRLLPLSLSVRFVPYQIPPDAALTHPQQPRRFRQREPTHVPSFACLFEWLLSDLL